jgi:DNA polymerase
MEIRYEGLEYDEKEQQFSYLRKKEGRIQRVRTYGGNIVENLCQALARIPTMDVMVKADRMGLGVALQAHDEVGVVVADEVAVLTHDWMLKEMRNVPAWMKGCPLDAEGGIGKRYGLVK